MAKETSKREYYEFENYFPPDEPEGEVIACLGERQVKLILQALGNAEWTRTRWRHTNGSKLSQGETEQVLAWITSLYERLIDAMGCNFDEITREIRMIRMSLTGGIEWEAVPGGSTIIHLDANTTDPRHPKNILDAINRISKAQWGPDDWGAIATAIEGIPDGGQGWISTVKNLTGIFNDLDEVYGLIPNFQFDIPLGQLILAAVNLYNAYADRQLKQVSGINETAIVAALQGANLGQLIQTLPELFPALNGLDDLTAIDEQWANNFDVIFNYVTGNYVTEQISQVRDAINNKVIPEPGTPDFTELVNALNGMGFECTPKVVVNVEGCGSSGGDGDGDVVETPPTFDPPPVDPPDPDTVPDGYEGTPAEWKIDRCHAANMLIVGIHSLFAQIGGMTTSLGQPVMSQAAILAQLSYWQGLANLHVGAINLTVGSNQQTYAGFVLNRLPSGSSTFIAGYIGNMPLSSGNLVSTGFGKVAEAMVPLMEQAVKDVYAAETAYDASIVVSNWVDAAIGASLWDSLEIIYSATISDTVKAVVQTILQYNLINILNTPTSLVSLIASSPFDCEGGADVIINWTDETTGEATTYGWEANPGDWDRVYLRDPSNGGIYDANGIAFSPKSGNPFPDMHIYPSDLVNAGLMTGGLIVKRIEILASFHPGGDSSQRGRIILNDPSNVQLLDESFYNPIVGQETRNNLFTVELDEPTTLGVIRLLSYSDVNYLGWFVKEVRIYHS